ncbi:MAG: hypothetical protein JWO21_1045 [Solirubrobacterales bacterium]|jgi:hypothetical protein|nr:hypothetical protein [Solirubrobacterales bacterium]
MTGPPPPLPPPPPPLGGELLGGATLGEDGFAGAGAGGLLDPPVGDAGVVCCGLVSRRGGAEVIVKP